MLLLDLNTSKFVKLVSHPRVLLVKKKEFPWLLVYFSIPENPVTTLALFPSNNLLTTKKLDTKLISHDKTREFSGNGTLEVMWSPELFTSIFFNGSIANFR